MSKHIEKSSIKKRITCILTIYIVFAVFVINPLTLQSQENTNSLKKLKQAIDNRVGNKLLLLEGNYQNGKRIKIDTLCFSSGNDTLKIFFSASLAEIPVREAVIQQLKDSVGRYLPDSLKTVVLQFYSNKAPLEKLVPNYYLAESGEVDESRLPQNNGLRPERKNLVVKARPYEITKGLVHSNIALWNSHGWYYEPKLNRWEWQRARLFTTLEDISPTAFVIPFIVPMLENAGATVFLPRERDWQMNEVIVDNDSSTGKSKLKKPRRTSGKSGGFAIGNIPYTDENPFEQGTFLEISEKTKRENVVYQPDFPESGEYAVSVSYAKGEGEVTYRVFHTGGTTDFKVDQRMGFGTWVYLGKFSFQKGRNKENGKVELLVPSGSGQKITADAVRFGGGMGSISRNGQLSRRARFFEGSRYYLQYSGAPDTLVWSFSKGENDYTDDYKSRGEWVNWLIGAPFGPTADRHSQGLGIPVDLSLAFHTDAGILEDDKIVGTLGIYSTTRDNGLFPDGQSKYASRDLTDLIQTQIVDDISEKYKTDWTRRGMWNSEYSESFRPNVPAMLLELLSHQNLNDVRYLLHPRYKFDVSRAIYKGMLRFLATQHNYPYIVQPLPVDHLFAEFSGENEITLKWLPVTDPLDPTAKPERYMVYQRVGDNGFDNGTLTTATELKIAFPQKGKVYSFRVTAVNGGGESFPSEEISVGISEKSKGDVLIVNGFDRVDSPKLFETASLSGVMRALDHGVAYGYDICTVGDQYDFERKSPWLDDDSPGHGASYGDLETTIFRGNTFDFAAVHGESILQAGYSFVTASDESVEEKQLDMTNYPVIDLLYGEEKTSYFPGKDSTAHFSVFTEKMLDALENYTRSGGNIFISGAYIGSDTGKDTAQVNRIGRLLKYKWRTGHAVRNVDFTSVSPMFRISGTVNTEYNLQQYPVEAPDAIEPFGTGAETILRYTENNTSAAVAANGNYKVVALGFPFECITNQSIRTKIIQQIFDYFTKD
ncbi:MAG: N-acetylmuramoyl-L-alanine amidase [Prolixibacteraceae bacterium]|jgi:hypothetical protein|nr:N-acetylmuramoyl-L-alanine amidase [Prolixibacteraceae bacterium]